MSKDEAIVRLKELGYNAKNINNVVILQCVDYEEAKKVIENIGYTCSWGVTGKIMWGDDDGTS